MLPNFTLARPQSVRQAVDQLDVEAVAYAGGTELLMAMKLGLLQPGKLVDLKRVPELKSISVKDNELVIGAAATHHQIARADLVQTHAGLLAEVENHVGNPRVRSAGTIGGNLCFAEPKSDVLTALIACDAQVVLESATTRRRMSVEEFTLGPYTTTLAYNELLTYVHIPLDRYQRGTYLKYQTMERPTVGVAISELAENKTVVRRVVVGAVSDRPVRFDFDLDESIDPQKIAEAIDPIPDLTGSVHYKRHVIAVYVQRALDQLSGADPR